MTSLPRFTIPATVVHREVNEQMVLLDLATEQYYGLDEVGTRIIALITTEPYDKAIERLLDDFEVDRAVLEADIAELADELIAKGLFVREEDV